MRKHRISVALTIAALFTVGFVLAAIRQPVEAGVPVNKAVAGPRMPEKWEIHPELFDRDGCLKLSPAEGGGRRCPVPDPPGFVKPESKVKSGVGFTGPYFADKVDNRGVVVLPESITSVQGGNWQAAGLVRNESDTDTGSATVTASLYGAEGGLLAEVSATVPVPLLRPGEPGPFLIRSAVLASNVARVEWSVKAAPARGSVSRDLLINGGYEVPYGVSTWKGVDRSGPTFPYELTAGVRNVGRPVKNATLTIAWLDDKDRVVWMELTALAPAYSEGLRSNGIARFSDIQVSEPDVAPLLFGLNHMSWVVGE